MELFTFILLFAIGIYLAIFSALFKVGLKSRRASRMTARLGEAGTRILYALTGIVLIVIAFALYF